MRKWRSLILGCAAFAMVAAIFAVQRDAGPYYAGHSLRHWVDRLLRDPYSKPSTKDAIAQIGTNAIPQLLEWVSYQRRPSPSKQWLISITARASFVRLPQALRDWLANDPSELRSFAAAAAFNALGSNAVTAIPQLLARANAPVAGPPSFQAINALAQIGEPALPALLSVITNKQPFLRERAVQSLLHFGAGASPAVPALIECLQDPDTNFVREVISELGLLQLEPQLAVPALIEEAQGTDPELRATAMIALMQFGKSARTAVPVLLRIREHEDMAMRANATIALQRIAPELLTNAPAQ